MGIDDEIKKRIELAGFKGNPGIENLARAAAISKNPTRLHRLERILDVRAALVEESHSFLSPERNAVAKGEISLATILRMDCSDGGPVAMPLQTVGQGIIVVGTTGSGKTYLVAYLCKQLLEHVHVLIFDRDGQFADLLAPEIASGKMAVVNYADFKRNLLEPMPKETPLEAINRITSAWRGGLFLRDASENMLAELIRYLYKERGIFEGSQDYPGLLDLHRVLLKMKYRVDAREKEYWQTLKNRVEHLINQGGDAFDCCQGFDIRDLLSCSLILNLMGLSDSLMRFVLEDFVSCALAYRERLGTIELKNVFVLDEAHRILSGQSQYRYDMGEALLHTMARTTRKRGIGLILGDQVPGQIPSAVMANMGTRIVLRLLNGPCVRAIAESMSLETEQRRYIPELTDRRAILHFPGCPKPFVIQIPELNFHHAVSEDEIKRQTSALLRRLKWVPRTGTETSASDTGSQSRGTVAGALEGRNVRNQDEQQEMAPGAKQKLDYLEDLGRNWKVSLTRMDKAIGASVYMGNKLRKELCEVGLIKLHHVNTGTRGGVITLVEITEKGWELLRRHKVNVKKPTGKGGFMHQWWQHRVREWFVESHRGCKATLEHSILGKAVDIGVETEDKKVAVEILIKGEDKELANVIRDLEVGWDEVVICCEGEETIKRLKTRLEETFGDRYKGVVSFRELREFMIGAKDVG